MIFTPDAWWTVFYELVRLLLPLFLVSSIFTGGAYLVACLADEERPSVLVFLLFLAATGITLGKLYQ